VSELIRFPVDSQTSVVVEVREDEGFERVARSGAITDAPHAFVTALHDVRAAAVAALEVFRQGPGHPDSIEIEFGVRLTAEVGAVIARSALEGHLAVKLVWNAHP
jgi:hypothetical protein